MLCPASLRAAENLVLVWVFPTAMMMVLGEDGSCVIKISYRIYWIFSLNGGVRAIWLVDVQNATLRLSQMR